MSRRRTSMLDLAISLGEHVLVSGLWVVLAVGIGESIPLSSTASTVWTVTVWSHPLRWALVLTFTFIGLVALLFPLVRRPWCQALLPKGRAEVLLRQLTDV